MMLRLGYIKKVLFLIYLYVLFPYYIFSQNILGNDILVCNSQYTTLSAGSSGPYLWSTGETTPTIRVYQDGKYSVNANNKLDTVQVTIYDQSYNQASSWAFGNGISLKFDTSAQTNYKISENILPNKFSLPAGNSSAVSNDGDLLFFTNGETIYDGKGNSIESGFSGDPALDQNSIITPVPGSAVEYYVYTIKDHKLFYSILHVDENKKITTIKKNILLSDAVDHKISAVSNNDNTGVWIVSHKRNSNIFQSFLLTNSGHSAPVFSKGGEVSNDTPGYMKISPDGTRIAIASDFTEVFYFDKISGKTSFPKHLFYKSSYGLEFSPNSNFLYVSSVDQTKTDSAGKIKPGGSLVRVNISYGYQTEILAHGNEPGGYKALQLAPDGKIYVVKGNNKNSCLGAIDAPNNYSVSNIYIPDMLCITGSTNFGLPNFPQHYFTKTSNFLFYPTSPCEEDSMHIIASSRLADLPYAKFSIKYDFGDPASGSNNISTLLRPSHFYPGKDSSFWVSAYTQDVCRFDTVGKNSYVVPKPRLYLIDTIVCPGAAVLSLDAENKYKNVPTYYLWIKGKDTLGRTQTFTPPISGSYRVEVNIGGQCDTTNLIDVTYKTFPTLDLGPTKNICQYDSVQLSVPFELPSAKYIWSSGDTVKNIYIKSQGKYKVSVLDQGCSISDSLEAFYFTKPLDPGFKKDTSGCFGGDVRLNALNNSSFNFLWSTGEISQEITVKTPGKYNVQISNSGCKSSFSSNINFHPPLEFPENNPETLCESDNQTITLSAGKGKNFKWDQSTLTNQVLVVGKAGSYTVTKFDIVTGCKESSIFNVKNICEPRLYFPTAFTPNQDGDNELFKPSFKNVGTYQINIYSRWGELIYYSENIEQGWDGTYKGQPAPVDNYIYTVNFEGENSAPNLKGTLKGSLILIR